MWKLISHQSRKRPAGKATLDRELKAHRELVDGLIPLDDYLATDVNELVSDIELPIPEASLPGEGAIKRH